MIAPTSEYRPLLILLVVVVALDVAMLAAIAIAKLLRERADAIRKQVREDLAEALIALIDTEGDAPAAPQLPAPRSIAGDATRETIVGFIAALKGEARDRLVALLETQGYVDATLRMLKKRSPFVRARAASLLGGMHSLRAIPALSETFLRDPSQEVRIVAAEALAEFGDAPSIDLLLHAVRQPTRYQEVRIAAALARLGSTVILPLEEALADPEERIVRFALDILMEIGAVTDLERIYPLLEHRSPEIRARAAELLGVAGAVDAIDRLVFASRDRQWFVRLRIVKALMHLGIPDTEDGRRRYYAALEHLLYDDWWYVRRNAAAVLAAAGERGREVLREVNSDVANAALQLHDLRHGQYVPTVL